MKGYVHLYTGNGKGKTTAAFGLALRAACAGKRVYIGQFVKSMKYNEVAMEELFDKVVIEQYGQGCTLNRELDPGDKDKAELGFEKVSEILQSGDYDLVILDEVTIALYFKLLTHEQVIQAIQARAAHVEVVMTGRYAPQALVDFADLVTEMKEVKHYYKMGVLSRDGIDR